MPFSRDMPMSRLSDNTDPFLQMRREMNRLFDDAFGGFGLPSAFGSALRQMPAAPKIDVSERDNEIQIKAEMPGIDQNDVEVLLEDDQLIIRGEKEEERDDAADDHSQKQQDRQGMSSANQLGVSVPRRRAPDAMGSGSGRALPQQRLYHHRSRSAEERQAPRELGPGSSSHIPGCKYPRQARFHIAIKRCASAVGEGARTVAYVHPLPYSLILSPMSAACSWRTHGILEKTIDCLELTPVGIREAYETAAGLTTKAPSKWRGSGFMSSADPARSAPPQLRRDTYLLCFVGGGPFLLPRDR